MCARNVHLNKIRNLWSLLYFEIRTDRVPLKFWKPFKNLAKIGAFHSARLEYPLNFSECSSIRVPERKKISHLLFGASFGFQTLHARSSSSSSCSSCSSCSSSSSFSVILVLRHLQLHIAWGCTIVTHSVCKYIPAMCTFITFSGSFYLLDN